MANNVNWGALGGGDAEIMPPSTHAGDGRCEPGEWGVIVEDVVVYGSRRGLRDWAQSIVDQLPGDRWGDGAALVSIDRDKQWAWLTESDVLGEEEPEHREWTATVESLCDLVQEIAKDPAAAGWTLGEGVTELTARVDEDADDGLVAGVKVSGWWVGGKPLYDDDLATPNLRVGPIELANAVLTVVADRINEAY